MAVANSTATVAYLTQSTLARSPASAGLDLSAEIIVCSPFEGLAEYQGTRAAIEAEGIIPADTKWPEGFKDLQWEDDKFRYWIRRKRPEGVKGPRKQFLDIDWWMLRCDPVEDDMSWAAKNIKRKAKELADEIYRHSTEGRAEIDKQRNAYCKALSDKKFQAFKSLIAGTTPPKRGRRSVAEAQASAPTTR